ncbi:N-terminal domain of NEFA-interacting nuclear protein NIP30-domain-containing protein [Peziza echinospora]|nr:N-terminal domain of NEFA-interacting nuclear protein NIP30-domain-containing protein [Peziza echinospora]
MSSGFVSGGVADFTDSTSAAAPNATPREVDSWTKAEEAVKLARWQQEEKGSAGKEAEEKSLFEILQANKARKQEEFEEKLKFKNQFKPLDEDDVEYLDSIMDEEARSEQLRKQELASQLDTFRKAQYEAEAAGNSEALEGGIPKVEDIVVGGWNASGRKRKKPLTSASTGAGSKFRKTGTMPGKVEKTSTDKSKAVATPPKATSEQGAQSGEEKSPDLSTAASKQKPQSKETVQLLPDTMELTKAPTKAVEKKVTAKAEVKKKAPAAVGLMGLVTYSSDEDDE